MPNNAGVTTSKCFSDSVLQVKDKHSPEDAVQYFMTQTDIANVMANEDHSAASELAKWYVEIVDDPKHVEIVKAIDVAFADPKLGNKAAVNLLIGYKNGFDGRDASNLIGGEIEIDCSRKVKMGCIVMTLSVQIGNAIDPTGLLAMNYCSLAVNLLSPGQSNAASADAVPTDGFVNNILESVRDASEACRIM